MARPKEFQEDIVLDKALELFWHKGYEATSVQDLVDAMGISRGSLYDTFGDKHRLFLRVLERYRQNSHQRFKQIFDDAIFNQNVPVKIAITRFLNSLVDEAVADPLTRGCLMTNTTVELAPHDAETAQLSQIHRESIEALLYRALQHGQATGEISPDADPLAMSRFLFMSIQGLRVVSKSTPERSALQSIVDVTLNAIN